MGYMQMQWIKSLRGLTPVERLVLIAIGDRCKNDGTEAWPSEVTIAQDVEVNVRSVKRAIKRAQELGYIEIVGNARSNVYRLRIGDTLTPIVTDCPQSTPTIGDIVSENRGHSVQIGDILSKNRGHVAPLTIKRTTKRTKKGTTKGASKPLFGLGTYPEEITSDEFKKYWDDWILSRHEAGHPPITPNRLKVVGGQLKKWGRTKSALALLNAASNGWRGLFLPKPYEIAEFEKRQEDEAEEAMYRRANEENRQRMEAQAASA